MKTSIDGLAVRSSKKTAASTARRKSGSSSRVSTTARSSAATHRTTKDTRVTTTRRRVASSDHTDPLLKQRRIRSRTAASEADEALLPVSRSAIGDSFVGGATADWSELLNSVKSESSRASEEVEADPVDDDFEEGLLGLPQGRLEGDDLSASEFITNEPSGTDALFDGDELDFSDELKESAKTKRKKKRHIGRTVALVFVGLLVISGVALYFWGDSLISRLTGGKSGLWSTISAMISNEVPFEKDANGRTNVLVFGTEGYNMNGDVDGGTHDGAQLTDSIMVVSFDQETKDVALLSLPRDLKVPRACSAGKINEVFWCHNQSGMDEEAGARALMQQVGEVLGIEFQYYAHVNWASLISIVDTLGGITVTLDEDINDTSFTGAVAQAGVPITVNGEQALGLARARHGTVGGDFTRGNTQQKIVGAIVERVVADGVSVPEALNLLNILGDNLRSNFAADNIKAGIRMVTGFNIANIRQIPLVDYDKNKFYVTTAMINDVSYVVPSAGQDNFSGIQEYVDNMFNSDPLRRENAQIAILNATDSAGVAGKERGRLEEAGFKVATIGDTGAETCAEAYCIFGLPDNAPQTTQALSERYGVPVQQVQEMPAGGTGMDFVIVVGKVE